MSGSDRQTGSAAARGGSWKEGPVHAAAAAAAAVAWSLRLRGEGRTVDSNCVEPGDPCTLDPSRNARRGNAPVLQCCCLNALSVFFLNQTLVLTKLNNCAVNVSTGREVDPGRRTRCAGYQVVCAAFTRLFLKVFFFFFVSVCNKLLSAREDEGAEEEEAVRPGGCPLRFGW